MIQFLSRNLEDTALLAQVLAKQLPRRCTVALVGTLGAGKTQLVRAFATASGVDPNLVTSPTFTLCNEYDGDDRLIYHLDAYRLADADEFWELGVEELFADDAVTFVEWADRVQEELPADCLQISIEETGETGRMFSLSFPPLMAAVESTVAEPLNRHSQDTLGD